MEFQKCELKKQIVFDLVTILVCGGLESVWTNTPVEEGWLMKRRIWSFKSNQAHSPQLGYDSWSDWKKKKQVKTIQEMSVIIFVWLNTLCVPTNLFSMTLFYCKNCLFFNLKIDVLKDDDWLKQLGLNFEQNVHFCKGKGAVGDI